MMFFLQCGQPIEKHSYSLHDHKTPFMEVPDSDTVMLAWDPPLSHSDSVGSYELWYRTDHSAAFSFHMHIPATDSPFVVLHRDSFPETDSVFFFRVRSVMKSGQKSNYHFTTDTNASPGGGWFLLWK